MRPHVALSLTLCAALAAANVLPVNERCVTSIQTAYGYIAFATSPSNGHYQTKCEDPLKVTSIYAASDVFCKPDERATGIRALETLCRELGFNLIPREQLAENLTEDAIHHMRSADYSELSPADPVDVPVLLTAAHYSRVFRTIDTWAYEMWTHYAYGYAGYLYWAIILGTGMVHRLVQHFLHFRHDHPSQRAIQRYLPFRQASHWVRTHFLVSTMIPSRGREFFWWTFSNRGEAFIVIGFWALSIAACAINYRAFPENIYFPPVHTQIIRYIADRTGIISFANLPLLWLFAGRNNICAWATGWNFATFNVFHRHVAWIATIQAVVHTVTYLILFFENLNPWKKLRKPYLLWGILATVLMVLILPAAVNWFRHRAYETFLFIHIILSIGLLVGCFYHTIIFEGKEYWGQAYWFYLWLPVGIWFFDRFLRLVRVIYCNLHVRQTTHSQVQYTSSLAIYDKAADLIQLEVMSGSSSLRPRPGQYYFLYQPFRLTGWESHPFTLGSWSYEVGRNMSPLTNLPTKDDETVDVSQIPLLSDDSSSGSRSIQMQQTSSTVPRELKLIFWIRPYDGWTRHLRRECLKSPDRTSNVSILLEGPYGHESPLWSYDSVLLIAGGTGIASAVPYINDHIARSSSTNDNGDGEGEDKDKDKIRTRIQDMQLIWVTRQQAFLRGLAARELRPALARDDFRASFYSTLPLTSSQRQRNSNFTSSHTSPTNFPAREELEPETEIEILHGRPNLEKQILAFAHGAQSSDSSAAVLVCGPAAMAGEARAAVYLAMRQGYELKYVEESFSW
ncbi:ferric reductase like transmembrane component-domain-containing protein [Aspergillus pseudoustus]|uniref:Ferric reductase like transmembrane component-domain-containing protein n=1 Tax=Aspergillus pseudoustus TaxID=1810923 RepID=A0ABR4KW18_9EURO